MDHEAINNVRRKINERLKKDEARIVVGWRPGLEEKRQEGDVWEDANGKQWTIKNGVRQNVTKLDTAKTPWWCPKCNKPMNHRFDIKFWNLRGHCMDCNIQMEAEIRKEGKWKEYERSIIKQNYISYLKDKISELEDYSRTLSNPEIIHADNVENRIMMVERWNVDLDKVRADIQKEIDMFKEELHKVESGEYDENTGSSN